MAKKPSIQQHPSSLNRIRWINLHCVFVTNDRPLYPIGLTGSTFFCLGQRSDFSRGTLEHEAVSEIPSYATQLLVLGSGPAGLAAAIYAARAGLNPIVLEGIQPGGQLTITTDVENYPGFVDVIQGPWLMDQMRRQAQEVGAKLLWDTIVDIDVSQRPFKLIGDGGVSYECETLVIATGAQAKWLEIESEQRLLGSGVSACATCDGFFYRGKKVVVIGGGNTAVEEALYMTNHSTHVTLIHRGKNLRGEKILQERLFAHPQISTMFNQRVSRFVASERPEVLIGIDLVHTVTGEPSFIATDGAFVAIGHKPATEIFRGHLPMDAGGYLLVQRGSSRTDVPGIFAAGDVTDQVYRQAVTAAGMGCMAALDAEKFLSAGR